jgi:hypothetical protein
MSFPSLLVTISYYSIPAVCWGGGLIHYQPAAGDGRQRERRRSGRCLPRLSRSVRRARARIKVQENSAGRHPQRYRTPARKRDPL